MPEISKDVIREPGTESPASYAQRVRRLAVIYAGMTLGSALGAALLLWRAKLLVTLAQRSNVETLTIAFCLIFFVYLAALGARGLYGAVRISLYALAARLGDPDRVERRKLESLGPPGHEAPEVALNVLLERADRPGEPFEIKLQDRVGSMGVMRVEGARLSHLEAHRDGSSNLFAYFANQVHELVRRRGERRTVDVVHWKSLDDESMEIFLSQAEFARNLARHLKTDLWPVVRLSAEEVAELEARLLAICPALRNEALLPQWEYEAEHKLPVVPEPLGLVSLSRGERRADPSATMGCAFLVVLGLLAVLAVFILFPPWVPGS